MAFCGISQRFISRECHIGQRMHDIDISEGHMALAGAIAFAEARLYAFRRIVFRSQQSFASQQPPCFAAALRASAYAL